LLTDWNATVKEEVWSYLGTGRAAHGDPSTSVWRFRSMQPPRCCPRISRQSFARPPIGTIGQQGYLDRADHFANQAVELFLDGCPLPKASHAHNHYEAISGADTLMMALLRLWAVRQEPTKKVDLVYTDR